MSVEVVTLGCRLNLSESDDMRAMLAGADDLVVINSCAVTAEALRHTRRAIRQARKARPDARLIVTGCAAEIERASLAAMPEVDGLVGNASKLDARAWNVPPRSPAIHTRHTRAFVQVQNGCDHSCTFCIIPQGRGPSLSHPVAKVLRDIERHLDSGAREVVLTGVDLTSWQIDDQRLGDLVAAILAAFPALTRLRLSSLDGIEIDPLLLELIMGERRVMPHIHLSMQSGNDIVLKRMKRRHLRRDAVALAAMVYARRPQISMGADIISGFPTENAAMHQNSLSIISELRIVHGHIFPYSPRPGTPAARMPQVSPAVIKARAAELRASVAAQRQCWLSSLIGTPLSVLAERDGTGHAENFARVQLAPGTPPGTIIAVTPTRIIEGLLA